jgi:secondary thiamine-phosphate synthase enzyme
MNTKTLSHWFRDQFTVATAKRVLTDITGNIREILAASGLADGLAEVFVHHTSCSLLLGENADPMVCQDLERFLDRLVRDGDPLFQHVAEGPDDMPAHVRSVLTGASLSIPVRDGALDLGTWQGAFLFEHRHRPHQRRITVTLIGE